MGENAPGDIFRAILYRNNLIPKKIRECRNTFVERLG